MEFMIAVSEAPAWKLFDLVKVQRKEGVTAPRSIEDYVLDVQEDALPQGVSCQQMG